MLRKNCVAVLFCLCAVYLPSGLAADAPAPDYSKEAFLIEQLDMRVRFTADGAQERVETNRIKILSDAGVRAWGVLNFPYSADTDTVEVSYVRVRKADGGVIVTPPANVLDLPTEVMRQAPLYSDLKEKQIPVKALSAGDTLEYSLIIRNPKPLVPGQFWFDYNFFTAGVTLNQTLEIRLPSSAHAKVVSGDVKPISRVEGADLIYTWKTSHAAATKPADVNEPEAEPEKPGVQITTFANYAQVGEWFGKLAQEQVQVSPAIQAKALQLTRDLSSEDAKIQALYDYVSVHFRYIGLDFGIGRYQPHLAEDVLENEYGDCKDKHTLFASLLKAIGVEAWPVLIHSTKKIDEDLPSPAQFDHVITAIPRGKQLLWLDTTPEVAPFGELMFTLRDKQALVIPARAPAYLAKTPANGPFPAEDHFVLKGTLNSEGTLTAHADLTLRSQSEILFRLGYHATASSQWQTLQQNISYRLGFAGEVSNVEATDPADTRKPFHVSWDYLRKRIGNWDDHQIGAPLPATSFAYINEEKEPKKPITVGEASTSLYESEMRLPSGFTMEAPPNVDLKTDFAEYHSAYSVKSGVFKAERRVAILKPEIPTERWRDYVSFQKDVMKDYNRMVTLNLPGAPVTASTAKDDIPEAGALVAEAIRDLQNNDTMSAQDALEKARKLNNHQTNLNAGFGFLYMRQGHSEMGQDALRAELKLHPDNQSAARSLGLTLKGFHRTDEAIEIYKTYLQAAPSDTLALTEILQMFIDKKRWTEARESAEKLVKLHPDNAQAQLLYGQVCIGNGKDRDGLEALKKAADLDPQPGVLSSIAVAAIQSEQGLEFAQQITRHALDLVAQKTRTMELDSVSNEHFLQMPALAQLWDVLGEILVKSGSPEKAEPYFLASWQLGGGADAASHLSEVYQKQGKADLASDFKSIAYVRGLREGKDFDLNTPRMTRTQSTGKPGLRVRVRDPEELISKTRTIRIPASGKEHGSADFLILFQDGKPTSVKMYGGEPRLAHYESALKNAKFGFVIPDHGPEHVLRRGILSCSEYTPDCMFLLMFANDANASPR